MLAKEGWLEDTRTESSNPSKTEPSEITKENSTYKQSKQNSFVAKNSIEITLEMDK